MHIAVQKNHLNLCWLLLGASLQPPQILDEVTVDHFDNVNVAFVLTLLDRVDQWGNTSLHTSAANGYNLLVQWHLKIGANYTSKNKFNLTPLDVASNGCCRNLLTRFLKGKEDPTLSRSEREDAVKTMLTKYSEYKSKLKDLINSKLCDISNRYDLNQIHQLIDDSSVFGMTKEITQLATHRLEWLKARRNILFQVDEVKLNAPIITVTNYEYVNELNETIEKTTMKESEIGLIPEELLNIIQDALSLCDRSNAEFNLNKAYCLCDQIPCANKSHEAMMSILDACITKAKKLKSDNALIENGMKTLARMNSELALTEAKDSLPKPRLPVDGMTSKQLKSYWSEEDFGHVKETEGFPLPPPGDGAYIWVKSKALQSLEEALGNLEECLREAESCDGNNDLIDASRSILKEKKTLDLKALLEKDENDRVAAIAVVEKAAKKSMKKKKGAKKGGVN